jgi:hypothetical protein
MKAPGNGTCTPVDLGPCNAGQNEPCFDHVSRVQNRSGQPHTNPVLARKPSGQTNQSTQNPPQNYFYAKNNPPPRPTLASQIWGCFGCLATDRVHPCSPTHPGERPELMHSSRALRAGSSSGPGLAPVWPRVWPLVGCAQGRPPGGSWGPPWWAPSSRSRAPSRERGRQLHPQHLLPPLRQLPQPCEVHHPRAHRHARRAPASRGPLPPPRPLRRPRPLR